MALDDLPGEEKPEAQATDLSRSPCPFVAVKHALLRFRGNARSLIDDRHEEISSALSEVDPDRFSVPVLQGVRHEIHDRLVNAKPVPVSGQCLSFRDHRNLDLHRLKLRSHPLDDISQEFAEVEALSLE